MIRFAAVIFFLGIFITGFGILSIFPWCVGFLYQEPTQVDFLYNIIICFTFGPSFCLAFKGIMQLHRRDAFLLTSFVWITFSILGAIPFYSVTGSWVDSIFESISGLTTTGATIIDTIETLPKSLLLWRMLLEWMGGIGVMIMALCMLPYLHQGIGILHSESSDLTQGLSRRISRVMVSVYVVLTLICICALRLAGLSMFDALCHALSCVSTGGFSNYTMSIQHFQSVRVEIILSIFMILGSMSYFFIGRYWVLSRDPSKDMQGVAFLKWLVFVFLVVFAYRLSHFQVLSLDSVIHTWFNVVSLVTTTGFSSGDYTVWGHFIYPVALCAAFIGGCSGSTAGGIKIYRLQVLRSWLYTECKNLWYPDRPYTIRYNETPLSSSFLLSVGAFCIVSLLVIAVVTLVLTFQGSDCMSALSAGISSLSNLGPALGQFGPAHSFASLYPSGKMLLAFVMLLGRLEIFTLLVIILPMYWKK